MIADTLDRLHLYLGMHPNLDLAIKALQTLDLKTLPDGRKDLHGLNVFANLMRTSLSAENSWEAHREYIDLQIVLENTEYMEYAPIESLIGFTPYDEARDIQQSQDPRPGTRIKVEPGMFALFFPKDAHKPGLGEGKGRKAVFKLKMQPVKEMAAPEQEGLRHLGTVSIKTDRLLLRAFQICDAEAMYNNWAGDERVARELTWETHESVETTKAVLENWVKTYESGQSYHWGIEMNGELIGDIALMCLDPVLSTGEIGYCLAYRHWNQGIMTEALKAVLRFLFKEVGIRRLYSRHDTKNPSSGKVMTKAGLLPEGVSRQLMKRKSGEFADIKTYAALRDEWLAEHLGQ